MIYIQVFYQALGAPPTLFQQHITTSCKKEKLLWLFTVKGVLKQKRPWQKYTLCQGRITLSAVPPWFIGMTLCA